MSDSPSAPTTAAGSGGEPELPLAAPALSSPCLIHSGHFKVSACLESAVLVNFIYMISSIINSIRHEERLLSPSSIHERIGFSRKLVD